MNNKEEKPNFICDVCFESEPLTAKFRQCRNCVHDVCIKCVVLHIESRVSNAYHLNCFNCTDPLDPIECRPLISSEIFEKWCDSLARSSVEAEESCYCPYEDCSELILDECGDNAEKCECPRCQRLFCYRCRVTWHEGHWCSEDHQLRDPNEKRFRLLAKEMNWTRCPNCGQPVERRDGCAHVRCRCGVFFCHDCGRRRHFHACKDVSDRRAETGACSSFWGSIELFLLAVQDLCDIVYEYTAAAEVRMRTNTE